MESKGDDQVQATHQELLQAQAHIYRHALGFAHSMSLKCAVELRIPHIISNHKKPMTHSELVTALQIPQAKSDHLRRLMRILVLNGFFAVQKLQDLEEDDEQEGYVLTLSSKLLAKDHSTYPLAFVITPFQEAWASFSKWLKVEGDGGNYPFEATHGMDVWNFMHEKNVDLRNMFNEAMAVDSRLVASVLVKECKSIFDGVTSLVDVGGGIGITAGAIAEAFPHIKCSVLDLPHIVASGKGSENLNFVGGDMFQAIPSADVVLFKWVLHDWDDKDCLKILNRCKEAIISKDKGGKVIIIDVVLDIEANTPETVELQVLYDVQLVVNVNGRERTKPEWEKLFNESGFSSYKITPILGFRSVIEVFP
nr:COMT protein [Stephania japonica]